jgi:hypothetical protein
MKAVRLHPFSLIAGGGLALIAFVAMGQAPATPAPAWEYKIVEDVSESDAKRLASEGWEFAGYLGEGKRGVSNDETLWRRPSK